MKKLDFYRHNNIKTTAINNVQQANHHYLMICDEK